MYRIFYSFFFIHKSDLKLGLLVSINFLKKKAAGYMTYKPKRFSYNIIYVDITYIIRKILKLSLKSIS